MIGPLPDPQRDYMQNPDVNTVGEAINKIQAEAREEYQRVGRPLCYLDAPALLTWALERQ